MQICQARRSNIGVSVCEACSARALSVCSSVADDGLTRLGEAAETLVFEAGGVLVREDDPANHIFNITKGAVRVYRSLPDGRRQIVGFLFPGDLLGLAAGERYAFQAEALAPVSACRFRRTDYLALLPELPALESALLERTCNELQAAQDQMLLLGRMSSDERVASFLLYLLQRSIRAGGDPGSVWLPMTRSDIADYLGLTTETVSRVFTRLKTAHVIRLEPHNRVAITDAVALEALASGSGD